MKRAEQKELTRQAIINAAIRLSEDKNFAGVSLRNIASEAGITPAAFYRHFKDMDELGLCLIDEVGQLLRQLMREARQRVEVQGSVVSTSIDTFMDLIQEKPSLMRFLAGQRAGGPAIYREALHALRELFVQELVDDLLVDPSSTERPLANVFETADLMVNLVFSSGLDALDLSECERDALASKLKLQLRIILMGSHSLYLHEQKTRS